MPNLHIRDLFDLKAAGPVLFRRGSSFLDSSGLLSTCGDSIDSGESSVRLRIRHQASFSGMPINGRLYPHSRVKAGASSLLRDYPKPVLVHHQSGGGIFGSDPCDPIGRVSGYRFESLVSTTKDANIDLRVTKNGTGVLHVESNIFEPDAVKKILDSRYLTTSVGFATDALVCTVCDTDWKNDQICEHRPGRRYPSESRKDRRVREILALLVTGNIDYNEWSFVNVPAAGRCSVTSHELINNALQQSGCLSIPTTSVLLDHLTVGKADYEILLAKDKEIIEVTTKNTDTPEDSSISTSVAEEGWVYEAPKVNRREVEDKKECSYSEPETPLSDDEFAYAHILKSLRDSGILDYDSILKEDSLSKNDVDLLIVSIANKNSLTTKQQRKLKNSIFCGPERTFPVSDSADVRAGYRLLNIAKVDDSTRASIRACLNRKNASMACGVNSKDMDPTATQNTEVIKKTEDRQEGSKTVAGNPADETSETTPDKKGTDSESLPAVEDTTLQIEALKAQVDALTKENEELATKVKASLARRLFDMRAKHGHPSTKNTTDDKKILATIAKLTERSTASLEDAIKDEELWGSTRLVSIPRGAVTNPALVDRTKDDAPVKKKQEASIGTGLGPANYLKNVANMFPRGDNE